MSSVRFVICIWALMFITWSALDMREAMLKNEVARVIALGVVFIVANAWLMLIGADKWWLKEDS